MTSQIELAQARLDDLEQVHQWIDDFAKTTGLNESLVFAIRLAIEEVFVNLIQHGYKKKPGLIRLSLTADAHQVTVTIGDHAPPFPPDRAPRPRLGQDLASRPVGGLGWHFIRAMMDEVRYRSDPQQGNVLTLIKRIDSGIPEGVKEKMQITISEWGDVVVVAPVGKIDSVTAEMFALALQNEIERGNRNLVVDLTHVDYLSSAGVHALTTALQAARQVSGDVRLAGANKEVRNVLSMSGLMMIMESFAEVEAAIQSFSRKES
jgi:anti-anti-sigma factor